MKEGTTISIDVAQAVLEVAISLLPGWVEARRRPHRNEVLPLFAQQPEATVLLEACGSASLWAREIEKLGHGVVLLPPQHVRRYRTRNKTDRADAKTLLEAFRNEDIRPVPVKTPAQQALAKQTPLAVRLRTVPGVGLLTATAIAGFVGDLTRFPTGRHFASYLGLTPSEHSSGTIRRLGAISKRGDTYLRMLLAHGARSVLAAAPRQTLPDRLRSWALELAARVGHNKATIALANKLARFAWVVATKEVAFQPREAAASKRNTETQCGLRSECEDDESVETDAGQSR